MSIRIYSAHTRRTTDETGAASGCMKIPGTFSGIDGFSANPITGLLPDGRYLKQAQIWTENGSPGDRVTNIRVEDMDGILSAVSGSLPYYPVVQYLSDQDITEDDEVSDGLGVPQNTVISITPIDPIDNRGLQFIP